MTRTSTQRVTPGSKGSTFPGANAAKRLRLISCSCSNISRCMDKRLFQGKLRVRSQERTSHTLVVRGAQLRWADPGQYVAIYASLPWRGLTSGWATSSSATSFSITFTWAD